VFSSFIRNSSLPPLGKKEAHFLNDLPFTQIQTKIVRPHPNANRKAPGSQKGCSRLRYCADLGNCGHGEPPRTFQHRIQVGEKGESPYGQVIWLPALAWLAEVLLQHPCWGCNTVPVALRVRYSRGGDKGC